MPLNDLTITKLTGGLDRRQPAEDMVSGLIANGVAAVGGVQLDTVYRLASLEDAEAILIDAAYDVTNTVLVFEHIKEFFRINPNGTLYLLVVAQTTTFADMVDPTKTNAPTLLQEADGSIRQLGVAYNPSVAVTDTTELAAAIPKAQLLADEAYGDHRPTEVLLEGKGFVSTSPIDFRALNAENVSVMIGQAASVATTDATYAAIGTLLGAVSKAAVNVNVAWVQEFNILGGTLQSISIGGTAYADISEGTKDTLDQNGSVFFRIHVGKSGIYFNDSHTATANTSDFAYIENNRTIHKATRLIRAALLPRLASPILIDPDTGQLSPEVIKSFENDGRKALELMLKEVEVSSIDVFVDPEQNILSTSELKVAFSIVPTGTARKITVTIGFVNPF